MSCLLASQCPHYGGSKFLRNVDGYIQDSRSQHPRNAIFVLKSFIVLNVLYFMLKVVIENWYAENNMWFIQAQRFIFRAKM